MNRPIKAFFLICLLRSSFCLCETEYRQISHQEYITTWAEIAVNQMILYKIPASITLAQGLVESASGNSRLARLANNHFGIKCHGWTGETIFHDDDKANECFRKYQTAELSFLDHSEFLRSRKRYAQLFTIEITDYKKWAHGLKAAGYATNPNYAKALIDLIEKYKLYEFDILPPEKPTQEPIIVQAIREDKHDKQLSKNMPLEIEISQEIELLFHENKVKYIRAKKGDSYQTIAKQMGLTLKQIYKYNDIEGPNSTLKVGDIVNLHPKKTKGSVPSKSYPSDYTIWEISQMEGVKLHKLMELNNLTSSSPNYMILRDTVVLLK